MHATTHDKLKGKTILEANITFQILLASTQPTMHKYSAIKILRNIAAGVGDARVGRADVLSCLGALLTGLLG